MAYLVHLSCRDGLHVGIGSMESLISLPAELLAVADPSVRGAAPLLRPDEVAAEVAGSPAPFDAVLALLAVPLPAGQGSPLPGKDLPAPPLDVAAAAADARPDPAPFAPSASDAALLARLRLAVAEPAAGLSAPSAAPEWPLAAMDAALPSSRAAALPTDSVAIVDTVIDLESAVAETGAEAPALDTAAPDRQTASADFSELPSWLESLAARDERSSRFAATAGEPRPSSPSPTGPAAPGVVAAAAAADPAAIVVRDGPSRDAPRISAATAVTPAEAPGISRPEWLPAAHGNAPSAAPAPAAPSTPVDVRTPGWQDAFANRVQWLVDSDVNEARITLHPPELGAVDVEISLIDDKTYVQLTTATASARDELSQSLPRLRELFAASGLELGGASVHDGRDSQQRFGHGDGAVAPSPRHFAPLAELGDEAPAALLSRPLGRIDVFA